MFPPSRTAADADDQLLTGPGHRWHLSPGESAEPARPVPRVRDFPLLHLVGVTTSYGRVDCLLERGRLGWGRLRQPAVSIPVADAGVLVAARADAWALRRQFKE
jgi:hypothetical protein